MKAGNRPKYSLKLAFSQYTNCLELQQFRILSYLCVSLTYVVCLKSSCSAMPWNCEPRIRTWGSNCQHSFLRGGFEAPERSCVSRATGIVGGEAMDSPPRQYFRALCINRAWVFGAQFHHRARTSHLLAGFSPPAIFSCSPNANWCCGGGIWGMWRWFKVKWHRCLRA